MLRWQVSQVKNVLVSDVIVVPTYFSILLLVQFGPPLSVGYGHVGCGAAMNLMETAFTDDLHRVDARAVASPFVQIQVYKASPR